MDEPSATSPEKENLCPICYGAGFVYPTDEAGHPDFSRVIPCRCSRERAERHRKEYLEKSSRLSALRHLTFESITLPDADKAGAQFRLAYQASEDFAASPEGWLILTGPSGSGKTHLAAAIANRQLSQGKPVIFTTAIELIDQLYAAINREGEGQYTQELERMKNTPLLILDDLKPSSGRWGEERMEQVITYRFMCRLPTVITTSTPIDKLSERIQTRILNSRICRLYNLGITSGLTEYEWPPGFRLQEGMTFENFDYKRANLSIEQRRNLEQAYHLALDFAREPENWLIFLGTYGCGKTHLAAAVVNYRYQYHQPALFVVVPELLDHLRSAFAPESKVPYDQLFEAVKTTSLLVLDDFGEQTATPWAQEKLYQIVNYRYNARLATLVTTSRTLDELEPRISSRFADPKISTPFNIQAPDYRCDISASRPSSPRQRSRSASPNQQRRGQG